MVAKKSIYSAHPSIAHWQAMVASLEARTGKDMEGWLAELSKSGKETEPEQRKWLKEEHGLGLSTIGVITHRAAGKSEPKISDPLALVEGIFGGEKAALRSVYEDIVRHVLLLGNDVRICPCETIVPFYRQHVFGQVRVPNRTTIHLGLALGDLAAEGVLVSTGGYEKKDRITHRIEMGINTMLNKGHSQWLRRAYERDEKPLNGKQK